MEQTIEIAEDFFRLNDIQINGKKSKLIVMNPSIPKTERKIKLNNEWVLEEDEHKVVRFLSVWLNSKLKKSQV